jgi:replicative DNA helicase
VENQLPWSEPAEIAILGAVLSDPNAVNDAMEYLAAEDFFLDSHQKIYKAILDLAETGNNIGLIEVWEELKRRREADICNAPGYLVDLMNGVPRGFSVVSYVKLVKDKSVLRSLISLCSTSSARASDQAETPATILGSIEERVLELSQAQNMKSFTTLLDALEDAGGIDSYVEKICDPAQLTGLSTGFKEIDKIWGGMQPANLIIVAARPSMGKSSWLFNTAVNVTTEDPDKVVALFSLEMSKDSFFKRMLASAAGVNARRAQEGFLGSSERARIASTLIRLAGYHIHIDDTAEITTMQIRARARRLKQTMGRLDMVGIDYVQLIKGHGKHSNRQEEVSSVSRSLKALSKELGVPVVALAQLSRKSEERGDKRPILSDLRESGSLEQDADVVSFIHRAEYYAADEDENVERGVAEFITAKNREGATGTRKLAYQADITRFSNLELQRSIDAY